LEQPVYRDRPVEKVVYVDKVSLRERRRERKRNKESEKERG
jgi:hypothetical protein